MRSVISSVAGYFGRAVGDLFRWRVTGAWLGVALSAFTVNATSAQSPGTIAGSVIDANTGTALSGAVVTLAAIDGLGLFIESGGDAARFAFARTVPTTSAGDYRFADLAAGNY